MLRARSFRLGYLHLSVSFIALLASGAVRADAANDIEEIVVRGYYGAVQKSIADKRDSDAIQDGVSADDLGRLSNKNSSEAVARLPGVNITQDQGEGRYVTIRGASPNLNNITVNGLSAGSVETNSRRVPLDMLGGELLSGIDVVKAVTPDMDGNAVGGSINVKTPSAFDNKQSFFGRATVQVGDQELDKYHPYSATFTTGGKFGSDQSLGAVLGVTYTNRHYLTKGLYADDWGVVPGINRGIPQSHKFNDYDLKRDRLGVTGALEYKSDDAYYYVRGIWTQTDETEYRYRGRNYFARVAGGLTVNGDGASGTYNNMRLRTEFRDQSTYRRIGNFSVGGENTFDQLKIDYAAALVTNKWELPTQVWTFQSADIFSGTFNMAPAYFEVTPNIVQVRANAARIGISAYSKGISKSTDKGYQLKFNGRYDLEGDLSGYLKAGVQFRSQKKFQNVDSDAYVAGTGGVAAFNVATPGVWAGQVLEGTVKGAYYQTGPKVDRVGLESFTDSNLNNPVVIRRDATASLSASTTQDFNTRENIFAGYAMGSFTFGDFNVLGGGRVEHTSVKGQGFDLVNGTSVRAVSRDGSYTNFLPAVHVRYNPGNGPFVLRGAWTNTIGRPEYSDITPTRTVTNTPFGATTFDGTISQGNPDLKAYRSHNLDLSAEYYFEEGGIASVAGFYKSIDGFIFQERIVQNNVTFEGVQYNSLTTTTPRNANNGKIKGLEFNYQQQFKFLPGAFGGLGLGASLTVVDSHLTVAGRPDKVKFVGQADKIYSLIGFYSRGPVEVVATYAWADNILFTLGAAPINDLYDENYGRLDVKASYRLTDNISLFVELQNLNDEPLGEFQGKPDYVTRKEIYGRTGYVGATVKW